MRNEDKWRWGCPKPFPIAPLQVISRCPTKPRAHLTAMAVALTQQLHLALLRASPFSVERSSPGQGQRLRPRMQTRTVPSHGSVKSPVVRKGWACKASFSSATSTSTAQFAKEMERVAAKEALLLAIKDTGGVEAFSSGTGSDSGRVDVNEKILSLERLNPTPRPTTSPLLEGVWSFQWAGAGSPGLRAARLVLQRFPSALVNLSSLTLTVAEEGATVVASVNLLNSIKSSVRLSTKLVVEGPLKLKEEYVEGTVETPAIPEGTVPPQLKGVVDQLLGVYQSFPETVKQTVNDGLKLPLSGTYSRQLLISYLDEEILIARDQKGAPDVLSRVGGNADGNGEALPEYLS